MNQVTFKKRWWTATVPTIIICRRIYSRKFFSGLPAAGWASYICLFWAWSSNSGRSTPLQWLIGVVSGKSAQRWRNHSHSLNAKLEQIWYIYIYIHILRQSNITMDNWQFVDVQCIACWYRMSIAILDCRCVTIFVYWEVQKLEGFPLANDNWALFGVPQLQRYFGQHLAIQASFRSFWQSSTCPAADANIKGLCPRSLGCSMSALAASNSSTKAWEQKKPIG